jgi:hypothetical protein
MDTACGEKTGTSPAFAQFVRGALGLVKIWSQVLPELAEEDLIGQYRLRLDLSGEVA